MAPVMVVLDPAITRHTPEWLWLSTGVRSVDHAVETLSSYQSNDFADGLAESALRLLVEGLPRVKADPGDLEGRLKCQIGAWQSMISIIGGVPMGASHAIGHILGGTCDVPHGYTSVSYTHLDVYKRQAVNHRHVENLALARSLPLDQRSEHPHGEECAAAAEVTDQIERRRRRRVTWPLSLIHI